MITKLTVAELKAALAGLSRIIAKRPNLEVLHCVLIQTTGGALRLSVTDLEQCATYHPATAAVSEPGPNVVVDIQRLKDALGLSSLGEAVLSLTPSGLLRVAVKTERGSTEIVLPVVNADEFPPLPPAVETRPADPVFLERFQAAAPFRSFDESRFIINGISLEAGKDGHTLVATDGRRMTAFRGLKLPLKQDVVVPCSKFLLGLKADGSVELGRDPVIPPTKDEPTPPLPWIHLRTGPWDYACKTLDGKFPQWRQVVPGATPPHVLAFAPGELDLLADALHTLPACAERGDRWIRLCPRAQGGIRLLAYDKDTGSWAQRDLIESRMTGPATGITLVRSYLLESVKAGFTDFRWSDDLSPMLSILRQSPEGPILASHVLMPMRTDASANPVPEPESHPVPAPQPSVALVAPTETDTGHTPPKTNPTPETTTPTPPMITPDPNPVTTGATSPADQLLAAYTAVKDQISAAVNALAELGGQLKQLRKQDRARQSELDNARALLVRLQTVKI